MGLFSRKYPKTSSFEFDNPEMPEISYQFNYVTEKRGTRPRLQSSFHRRNGILNGPFIIVQPNGWILKGTHENGHMSETRIYDLKKRLREETAYHKHDWGYKKTYDEDGLLVEEGAYDDDGLASGTHISYYKNGQTRMLQTYSDAQLDGPYEKYSEDGSLVVKGQYKDHQQEGIWHYPTDKYNRNFVFYKDGVKVEHASSQQDLIEKLKKSAYAPEADELEANYQAELREALSLIENDKDAADNKPQIFYHSNGQISYWAARKDGILHGPCTLYLENGDIEGTGENRHGAREGIWHFPQEKQPYSLYKSGIWAASASTREELGEVSLDNVPDLPQFNL